MDISGKVDQTINGVMYSGENELDNQVEIRIKGTFHSYLFLDDSFSGDIYISSIDYTKEHDLCKFKFDDNVYKDVGYLIYETKNNAKTHCIGSIWMKNNWKFVIIQILDEEYVSKNGQNTYIVAPADSLNEAKKMNYIEQKY